MCVTFPCCAVLQETVRSLKERACAAFGVDPAKVEIWDYFNNGKYGKIENILDKDLESARIMDEQPILLDDKVRAAYRADCYTKVSALLQPAAAGCYHLSTPCSCAAQHGAS